MRKVCCSLELRDKRKYSKSWCHKMVIFIRNSFTYLITLRKIRASWERVEGIIVERIRNILRARRGGNGDGGSIDQARHCRIQ